MMIIPTVLNPEQRAKGTPKTTGQLSPQTPILNESKLAWTRWEVRKDVSSHVFQSEGFKLVRMKITIKVGLTELQHLIF